MLGLGGKNYVNQSSKVVWDSDLALLAKQGWMLLTNQNSWVEKIFKAKYFPNGDILKAKLGSSPSYTWRSIYNSLEVIRGGA